MYIHLLADQDGALNGFLSSSLVPSGGQCAGFYSPTSTGPVEKTQLGARGEGTNNHSWASGALWSDLILFPSLIVLVNTRTCLANSCEEKRAGGGPGECLGIGRCEGVNVPDSDFVSE